jgi:hypothetical protein
MGYRDTIQAAVKGNPRHPSRMGVKMQAHHLVSKKGLILSNLKADLEHLGYDINALENLTLIPCTLQGACHLGVQLHRGNHATGAADFRHDDNDDDGHHGITYHLAVAAALGRVKADIDRARLCDDPAIKIQERINKISSRLMFLINSFALALTSIHTNFNPVGDQPGCCGVDSIGAADPSRPCPTGRNHQGRQSPGQQAEAIRHPGKPYVLGVGQ